MDKLQATKLKLTVGDRIFTATLVDNPTSRDFLSLLPLTAEMKDYAAAEKISYLSRKLVTEDGPGSDAKAGDISYYAPWGNIVLYYKDGVPSPQLVKIAALDSDPKAFNVPGPVRVTIEALQVEGSAGSPR